jgi:dihydroflavonol-4-reductase
MPNRTAFVTGSTGLLGNNLVRALLDAGWRVRALARSADKAKRQFADAPGVAVVACDMSNVAGFAEALADADAVFHTAAYFRDNYKGGSHWEELKRVNVDGTAALLAAAYQVGVRNFVHTSSVAVLSRPDGAPADETNERDPADADDYYRSKILSDRAVLAFLAAHPDMRGAIVLPGWMWGPGDIGPTSSGQVALDVVRGKLPAVPPGSFSLVDARDVAAALIAAADRGASGERYLAAGRQMTMREAVALVGRIAGVRVPSWEMPKALLLAYAATQEAWARVSGRPVVVSLASARLLLNESDRSRYNHAKSERVLGVSFRPAETTVADTIAWYREHGWLPAAAA